MKIVFHRLRIRVAVLTCIVGLASMPVWAEEEKSKTESKTRSTKAEVEIRVKSGNKDGKPDSEANQEDVTVVVGVAGDQSDAVKSAVEKLEKQLKSSGISEVLQQKALESLRAQMNQLKNGGKASWSSGKQTSQTKSDEPKDDSENKVPSGRFEVRLPFDRLSQDLPSAMVQAFSGSNAMGPAQKEKLRHGIREALEESGIESEVVDKALKRVDKTLNELGSHASFSWRGSGKLPYRLGIGCKQNAADDARPGLEVETVFEDSPAANVGLKPGDRLISIDKQPIRSHDDIVAAVQKAGEENRSIQLEAMRGDASTVYEIKPQQTAVAELHTELFQPGGNPFSGQAWIMPQWQKEGANPLNDPKLQEKIRDTVKEAVDAARRGAANRDASQSTQKDSASSEDRNEKNIDELRSELSGVHKELEEIKNALKKLSPQQ